MVHSLGCLQQSGLDQTQARSPTWVAGTQGCHPLLPPRMRIDRELDQEQRNQTSNQALHCGVRVSQVVTLSVNVTLCAPPLRLSFYHPFPHRILPGMADLFISLPTYTDCPGGRAGLICDYIPMAPYHSILCKEKKWFIRFCFYCTFLLKFNLELTNHCIVIS